MFQGIQLDAASGEPLYRQLYETIKGLIGSGALLKGQRLPATRELAGLLGLNRTTISAAYALLESDGLIQGHVGRGSFVAAAPAAHGIDWERVLPPAESAPAAGSVASGLIAFTSSRPDSGLFPVDEFQCACSEVLSSPPEARAILQLGSPAGYGPLRDRLLAESRQEGVARENDDVLITNGCQQSLNLLQRVLVKPGETVLIEDPVYPGLRDLFARSGARLVGIPVDRHGVEVEALERAAAEHKPRLIVVTPNFQNPTGTSLTGEARRALVRIAHTAGAVLVENDIYGELRYEGARLPSLKELDETGDAVLLRSFSKLAFPGLRVGWVIAPRLLIARLTEAKRLADLHTDQFSQAILLRFAQSGRLAAHRERVLAAGRERLRAALAGCETELPAGSWFTRPQGGMSLWVRLPEPLDASELLLQAERRGVSYLPGRYFEVSRRDSGTLRLSFAALAPDQIRAGLAILGEVFTAEAARAQAQRLEPAPAMV